MLTIVLNFFCFQNMSSVGSKSIFLLLLSVLLLKIIMRGNHVPIIGSLGRHFFVFRTYLMGSICCQIPTREGCAIVWVCVDHSSIPYCINIMHKRYWCRWIQFSEYLESVDQICVVSGQCAADYVEWFYRISHPFISPTQTEAPPRHPHVVQNDTFIEPDIPQHLVAATTMVETPADAPVDVDMPRHVVV